MKNILAIHDLSCFGRCSLTVIIPTLSAMSHQVTPLPSALLSTHTGGFTDMTFIDLTAQMKPGFEHMRSSGAHFDAVYSGFLGSSEQIDTVSYIIKESPDALIFVDPVMGDDGKLYQTYTTEMKNRMSELCSLASVITPNLTEAVFLLDENYVDTASMSIEQAREFANDLCIRLKKKYGCRHIALTGVEASENGESYVNTAVLSDNDFDFIVNKHVGTGYPGTGDIFASVLLGEMLNGKGFAECAERASRYIAKLVSYTFEEKTPVRNGVSLENHLKELIQE
ncbi:MAG: pyridoxamine kinase [Clostridia bacterium]|nr:pyridoxamine kinase [Clostridia bacterium]